MTSVTDFDIGSLIWVKGEIDQALDQAAASLQQFAGQPLEAGQLRFSLTHLHQVTGAINMVGLDALGRFSEEIELAVQAVDRGERALDAKAVSVLADAITAFKAYLDDLVNSRADASLALFPFFRGLRQFRGEAARESELFYPDLNVGIPPLGAGTPVAPNELLGYLKDQRNRFQMGLLQWIRDHNAAGLQAMFHVLRNVARVQASSMGRGFWWSSSALVEVVAYQGIDVDADIRQIFTRLDLQLRRAAEGSPKVAERLFRDILYLIAVSRVESPNIKAVRQAFQLLAYLPSGALDLDRAAVSARAQSAKTLLQTVKDAWSKYTSGNTDKRAACIDALGSLYTASAALGKPEFATVVAAINNAISSQDKPLEDNQAMEVATALLLLENALNLYPEWPDEFPMQAGVMCDRLQAVANAQWNSLPAVGEVPMLDDATRRVQERQLQGQVAREIRANLQHVEQTLDSYFRQQIAAEELQPLSADLRQIKGALSILDMPLAQEVLSHCASMIASFSSESNLTSLQDHQDVAEGLSALGFYIDEYELGRDAASQVLEPVIARIRGLNVKDIGAKPAEVSVAQTVEAEIADQKNQAIQLLDALREKPEDAEVKEQLVETLSSMQQNADLIADSQLIETSKAALQLLETDSGSGDAEELHEELHEAITGQDAVAAESAAADDSALLSDEAVDAELLEIYLEEAQEVLGNVAAQLELCAVNPHDKEALTVIRRSYHTLKGSGRMVGLNNLGDIAWGVEQMMNEWLQAERSATPAMLHVLEQARAQFLGWVEQLQAHGTVRLDPKPLTSMTQLLRDEPDLIGVDALLSRLEGQLQSSADEAVEEAPQALVAEPAALVAAAEEVVAETVDETVEPQTAVDEAAFDLPVVFGEEAVPDGVELQAMELAPVSPAPEEAPLVFEAVQDDKDIQIGPISISPVLFGIFAEEAQKHLLALSDGLRAVEVNPQAGFGSGLLFAAHTLRGIAHTTGFRALGELGEGLETWLAARTHSHQAADDNSIALFETAVHHAERMVGQILARTWPDSAEDMVDALQLDLEGSAPSNAELLQASMDTHEEWTQVPGLPDEGGSDLELSAGEVIEAGNIATADEELLFDLDSAAIDTEVPAAHSWDLPVISAEAPVETSSMGVDEPVFDLARVAEPELPAGMASVDDGFEFDLDAELPAESLEQDAVVAEEPVVLELEAGPADLATEAPAPAEPKEIDLEEELIFELEAGLESSQAPQQVEEELVLEEDEQLAALQSEPEEETFEFELDAAAEDAEPSVVLDLDEGEAPAGELVLDAASADAAAEIELTEDSSELGLDDLVLEEAGEEVILTLEEGVQDELLTATDKTSLDEPAFEVELQLADELDAELLDDAAAELEEQAQLDADSGIELETSFDGVETVVLGADAVDAMEPLVAGPVPEPVALAAADAESSVPDTETEAVATFASELEVIDTQAADAWSQPEPLTRADAAENMQVIEELAAEEADAEPVAEGAAESEQAVEAVPVDEHVVAQAAVAEVPVEAVAPADVVAERPAPAPAFIPMTAEMIGSLVAETSIPGIPAAPLSLLEQALAVKDDIDEQLLPIFIEEGQELLPEISANVRKWRESPESGVDCSKQLKRLLHTLKGSARMAGAMRLGEATHHIETRLIHSLDAGGLNESLLEDLASDVDVLDLLFEALVSGEVLALPADTPAAPVLAAEADIPTPVKADVDTQAAVAGAVQEMDPAKAQLRVRADVIDRLVNDSGEVAIARSRIEAEMIGLKRSLHDLTENVGRLRAQLREIEIQAESQMQSRLSIIQDEEDHFDPLEFDRFTRLQELTRFMAESVNDVATIQFNLLNNLGETEAALQQQGRMTKELQQQLMRIRMVPFSNISERLYRIVRQTGKELGKKVNLEFRGGRVEIDRSVLEKMTSPFEHMLRNSIDHGLETREQRLAGGKSEVGEVRIEARQEGNELILTLHDDGRGMDLQRIRQKGIEKGLLQEGQVVSEDQLLQLIFAPGFSTAQNVTQISGRGIGMDVVRSEIVNLGGRIEVQTSVGHGSTFIIHLPLTMAVTHVVLVRVGERQYAIPSIMVEQVQELKLEPLGKLYEKQVLEWMGNLYPFSYMGRLLGDDKLTPETRRYNTVLLIKTGTQRIAVHVDELIKNLEVVVKNISPQLARVPGISGATVLGNGDIVMILNPIQLMSIYTQRLQSMPVEVAPAVPVAEAPAEGGLTTAPVIMVVDDSLTVRKITGRLLAREGYQVMTAKDGVDALQQLQEMQPDVMLLDIEMPRMDGFELTRNIRGDAAMREIPIIMISSRTADKHKNYAHDLGVNVFLGKPYQEDELLGHIKQFCAQRRGKH